MASSTNLLDTKTVNLNDVLGNGKIYRVPQFQRDYSWDEDNWEDLWNDLMYAHKHDEPHYMGSIVLQSEGDSDRQFHVIDGQQRFSTLSILALAVIKKIRTLAENGIESDANYERVEILTRQFIGQKDPASLTYSSKLFLNENNDGFYQSRLVQFRDPVSIPKLSDSEKLLWKAYQYFLGRIEDIFGLNKRGDEITTFLTHSVAENLRFIQITVKDELNAYTVFETLNSRRVDLTATDLLKNFLFSLVSKSPSDLAVVKNQWKKIVDVIGLKKFPVFLRHYLNSRRDLVAKEYLFKSVKQIVRTDNDVLDLLDHLESQAYTYNALVSPSDDYWKLDKELEGLISALSLFNVTLCHPLLLAVYDKLPPAEFKKVLRVIVNLSFRYNVIGRLQTNKMEEVYNRIAVKVFSGKIQRVAEIIAGLNDIYLSDEEFRKYFELRSFNTSNSQQRKIVRYILYQLNAQVSGGSEFDFDTDEGTIEHILPESLNDIWRENFREDQHEKCVYLIGNLTLLEPTKNNKEAADKSFTEKLIVYQSSKYALTTKIGGLSWTPKMIEHRQLGLAKTACGIWKI
jgi:hypothetical protein